MFASRRLRAAAAGAAAATVWGLLEPLDTRLFRSDYRDVALLGKLVTSGRGWKVAGYALHAANGALFGVGFDAVLRRSRIGPRRLAVGLALAENLALYPLGIVVDRKHPRRDERDVGPLWSRRVFAQETFRHAVFGLVLGSLAEVSRWSAPPSRRLVEVAGAIPADRPASADGRAG